MPRRRSFSSGTSVSPHREHLIEAQPFHSPKLLVAEVASVNDLRDPPELARRDRKLFTQGLKGAVLVAVAESLRRKHVKRHRAG